MHAPDVLTQSSPDEVEEVLKSLMGVEEQSASTCLELWVENLREWLSKQVRGGEGAGGKGWEAGRRAASI